LMHPILDPGPQILAEAAEVVQYPAGGPLDEASIRQAAEGCVGIVSQLWTRSATPCSRRRASSA